MVRPIKLNIDEPEGIGYALGHHKHHIQNGLHKINTHSKREKEELEELELKE